MPPLPLSSQNSITVTTAGSRYDEHSCRPRVQEKKIPEGHIVSARGGAGVRPRGSWSLHLRAAVREETGVSSRTLRRFCSNVHVYRSGPRDRKIKKGRDRKSLPSISTYDVLLLSENDYNLLAWVNVKFK